MNEVEKEENKIIIRTENGKKRRINNIKEAKIEGGEKMQKQGG
jgi:hypothetical protein